MNYKRTIIPLLKCLSLIIVISFPGYGQDKGEIFAVVPAEYRARLITRLNLYLENERANRQKDNYALYDEETLCSLCVGKGKCTEDCAPPMEIEEPEDLLIELLEAKPLYATRVDNKLNMYLIKLEVKERIRANGKFRIGKRESSVRATLKNGEWYFSLMTITGDVLL